LNTKKRGYIREDYFFPTAALPASGPKGMISALFNQDTPSMSGKDSQNMSHQKTPCPIDLLTNFAANTN
jgi:hypothetical protein